MDLHNGHRHQLAHDHPAVGDVELVPQPAHKIQAGLHVADPRHALGQPACVLQIAALQRAAPAHQHALARGVALRVALRVDEIPHRLLAAPAIMVEAGIDHAAIVAEQLRDEVAAAPGRIVVVSPRSYFVFTPLLASTSVGTLEFRCALEPARARKGEKQGPQFFQGWADGVDLDKQTLCIEEAVDDPMQGVALAGDRGVGDVKGKVEKGKMFDMSWDKLVVAVGCYSQTFDTKGVREHAYFLKDVGDARKIRNRLLSCFEMASLPTTSEEMKRMLLNFAVVGGGPTGIEWSAELCDMIEEDMKHLYPDLVGYAKVRRRWVPASRQTYNQY